MHPKRDDGRSLMAVMAACTVAFLLIVLNLLIQFSDAVGEFFKNHKTFLHEQVLLDVLFVWLAVVLLLAFRSWRQSRGRTDELDAVLSSISPDALLVVSPDRTIRMCNDSVLRIFGYEPGEVLNRKTDVLYSDRRRDPSRPREIYEALERDGFHYGLAGGKRKDGSTIPLEIISADLVGRGGAVLLVRDITERLALEAERRRMEEKAQQMQRVESLGMLASGIAHDFKGTLQVIQGYLDLIPMQIPNLDGRIADNLKHIEKGVMRGRDLCEKLMSFAGKPPERLPHVDLNRVTAESVRLLSVGIPQTIKLVCDLGEAMAPVRGDQTQINQVVMNLVSNSKDAIGPEGGVIRIRTGVGDFDETAMTNCRGRPLPRAGRYAFLEVSDTGCGMDAETVKRVCELLFTTKGERGHGLGMAAVLRIIRVLEGLLRIESTPGQGTTVTVYLPVDAGGTASEARG